MWKETSSSLFSRAPSWLDLFDGSCLIHGERRHWGQLSASAHCFMICLIDGSTLSLSSCSRFVFARLDTSKSMRVHVLPCVSRGSSRWVRQQRRVGSYMDGLAREPSSHPGFSLLSGLNSCGGHTATGASIHQQLAAN